MHSASLIADYIIANGNGALTPLQVIKLVYIAHGYTLAITGDPLIKDRIEAWKYGPVIPVLYDTLKVHGGKPVPSLYYCSTRLNDAKSIGDRRKFLHDALTPKERDVVDKVLDEYMHLTGSDLIDITHETGTPWDDYYNPYQHGVEIPNDAIQKHYEYIYYDRA